jgi:predicted XRE-type DNA-binding protein
MKPLLGLQQGSKAMSKESIDAVLDAARKLPLDEQHRLVKQLMKELSQAKLSQQQIQEGLDAVEQTRGSMKGLDRETIIWLAEDEELCGY